MEVDTEQFEMIAAAAFDKGGGPRKPERTIPTMDPLNVGVVAITVLTVGMWIVVLFNHEKVSEMEAIRDWAKLVTIVSVILWTGYAIRSHLTKRYNKIVDSVSALTERVEQVSKALSLIAGVPRGQSEAGRPTWPASNGAGSSVKPFDEMNEKEWRAYMAGIYDRRDRGPDDPPN